MSWPSDPSFVPRAACYRCFKPAVACICVATTRVANRTGITILQHPHERFHAVGTERIARLGFANIRVELLAPWDDAGAIRARIPSGAALLYPGPGACEVASLTRGQIPPHLVIIDGTWFQAKKVYAAHSWLAELPQVRLSPSSPSRYRVRREPQPMYVATIEAIVEALRILEPHTIGLEGLLQSFVAMVDRQAQFQFGQSSRLTAAIGGTAGGGSRRARKSVFNGLRSPRD
jgi:DTW domain-containing protein